jgi:mono/diheme cytochrome c family protein
MKRGKECILLVLSGITAGPAVSQPLGHEFGREAYLQYCASCHGTGGRGDGPNALTLKVIPTDLTMLAALNKGVFPSAMIIDVIKNGSAPLGHGTEMPAWSKALAIKGNPSGTRSRIARLVRYIESLQKQN